MFCYYCIENLGRRILFLLVVFILVGCTSTKSVHFKTPVATTSVPIAYQTKKTFKLNDVGVYASNEFDGARLSGLEKINDSTALAIINPENVPINNSPYYAFQAWSDHPRSFYFTYNYPVGYKHRYIPKIKKEQTWSILDSSNILKNDTIVTIKLDLSASPIIVAAQEIESSKDVEHWYTKLLEGKEALATIGSLGRTDLGRNLPVINLCKGSPKGKDIIVLLTRQHPPEVTGYYAFQNFLETILDGSEQSQNFLANYHVIAFPIMNPDGVDLGHWRHNSGGVDLNRDWSIYNQPEIRQAVKYIEKNLKKQKAKLVLGLDFHSTWYDIFYTNKDRVNTALPNFIDEWFQSLENEIPDYKVNEAASNSDKPVSKGWFLYGHNAVGITYEIGDATPKDRIKEIGKVTAEQMMKIMVTN